jgi:hypothetical protein
MESYSKERLFDMTIISAQPGYSALYENIREDGFTILQIIAWEIVKPKDDDSLHDVIPIAFTTDNSLIPIGVVYPNGSVDIYGEGEFSSYDEFIEYRAVEAGKSEVKS